jgi:Helix-turn-helix domain
MREEEKRQQANGVDQSIATAPTQSVGGLKLKPAAQYLGGLSVPTMHRLIQRGLLRPNRALRHLLFPKSELDRFLRDGMNK